MFGEKAARIAELEAIELARDTKIIELEASVLNISRAVELKAEAYDVLDASFQDTAKKNCKLNVEIADMSMRLDSADLYVEETRECNEVLHEENSDLVRQLDLLRSVLKQLHIVVKVPARKK